MNIFAVITFISAIICIIIADIVYHGNKKEPLNRLFALSGVFTSYLLFYYFMCRQADTLEKAMLWMKIGSFWYFTVALYIHFILIFTEKKRLLKNKITYLIIYLPASVNAIMTLATNILTGPPQRYEDGGFYAYGIPQDARLFNIFIIWLLFLLTTGIVLCFHYFFTVKDRQKKRNAGYVLVGFLMPFISSSIEEVLNLFGIKPPETTAIGITWMTAWIGYAIWKYDLFKIDPAKAAENIIESIPDSFIMIDLQERIIRINHSFTKTFGYSDSDIINERIGVMFYKNEEFNTLYKDLLKSKTVENHETQFRSKTGSVVPVIISGSAIRNARGATIGTLIVIRDNTERKRSEEELKIYNHKLKQSNRELQDFAYAASHDLLEPLRKIMAFGARLKGKYSEALAGNGGEYIDRMQNAALRMQDLINGLLAYSRVTTKTEPYALVDLNDIVSGVIYDLETAIEKTSGRVMIAEELPCLNADALQMRQLFQNLVSNALKFHKPDVPPVVKIFSDKNAGNGFCVINVEDNGIGIEVNNYERIFGMFQRLHGRSEYEGDGIGLAVCKKIVEKHGGSLGVDSRLGEGTKFLITMPA